MIRVKNFQELLSKTGRAHFDSVSVEFYTGGINVSAYDRSLLGSRCGRFEGEDNIFLHLNAVVVEPFESSIHDERIALEGAIEIAEELKRKGYKVEIYGGCGWGVKNPSPGPNSEKEFVGSIEQAKEILRCYEEIALRQPRPTKITCRTDIDPYAEQISPDKTIKAPDENFSKRWK